MKAHIGFILAALGGVAIACALVAYEGVGDVLGTLAMLGWGFAPVFAVHLAQLLCSALAWRPLVASPWPRPLELLTVIRWIREAINGLLPVAHVGGEIVGARLLSLRGGRGDIAGASVVLDVTVEVVTQLLFTLAGIALLVVQHRAGEGLGNLVVEVLLGTAAVAGFIAAQRFGLFRLIERFVNPMIESRGWLSQDGIRGLHDAIQALHRDRAALAVSAIWHSISWLLGAIEVWLALRFMGFEIGLREALIVESLGQAAHSVGFVVPGGIGVQEGGLVLAGAALGVPAEAALALSLAKRLREVILGVPALLVWQYFEGRRLWLRRA